jgi:methylmalonyl-CoA mutase N-terminal domain/subunit
LQRIDDSVERDQVARLQAFRSARNQAAVDEQLSKIREAAKGKDNLMPHFVEAVDTGATLGEICNVLRDVFGVYRAKEVVA